MSLHAHHQVTASAAQSAALAVREGHITEAEIDVALRRLLATKFKLGLFDPDDRLPYARTTTEIVDSPPHQALAREAAVQSVVLLKNAGGILPLRTDPASILVVGPTAANVNAMLGNYAGISSHVVTFVEGMALRSAWMRTSSWSIAPAVRSRTWCRSR